jgi:hypothetical protein
LMSFITFLFSSKIPAVKPTQFTSKMGSFPPPPYISPNTI